MFGIFSKKNKPKDISEYEVDFSELCISPRDLDLSNQDQIVVVSKKILDKIKMRAPLQIRAMEAFTPNSLIQFSSTERQGAAEAYTLVFERQTSEMTSFELETLYQFCFISMYNAGFQKNYSDQEMHTIRQVIIAFVWGGGQCSIHNPNQVPKNCNFSLNAMKNLVTGAISAATCDNYPGFVKHWSGLNQAVLNHADRQELLSKWKEHSKTISF